MPRMDDPNLKMKPRTAFKRKTLRPWDDVNEFKPSITNSVTHTIDNQIENNKETISKHLINELVNENEAISEQKDLISKQIVNLKETIMEPNREQTDFTISKQLDNQTVNNTIKEIPAVETLDAVKRLYGLQRKLLLYIVENCKSRGLLYTTPITNETLRYLLDKQGDTVKTSIQRLINKGLIRREKGKRGKGGFSVFIITENIRNSVIEVERQLGISNQLGNQLVNAISKLSENNWGATKETMTPSSSSSNKITTTTDNSFQLPPEWEEIELSELHKRNVRFNRNHIIQFFNILNKYTAFDFQESIDGFAHDIDHGHVKARNGFLNLFIGVITKGGGIYQSAHYISPEQQKFNEIAELSKKRQIEKEEAQKQLEHDKFNAWIEEKGAEVICEKLPVSLQIPFRHGRDRAALAWIWENLYMKGAIDKE